MRSFALLCLFVMKQTLHTVACVCCEQLKRLHWLVIEEYVIVSQAARQRQHCVNGDCLEIRKWQNLTPHRIKTPKPIDKNCHGWLGRRDDPLCQIWCKLVHGVFWGDMRIFELSFFFIYLFSLPAYRSDPWTELDAQYTNTRGIMQGSNLWGFK